MQRYFSPSRYDLRAGRIVVKPPEPRTLLRQSTCHRYDVKWFGLFQTSLVYIPSFDCVASLFVERQTLAETQTLLQLEITLALTLDTSDYDVRNCVQ